MTDLAPLVTVIKATSRRYRALFNSQLWGAEWELALECGHVDTRPVRFSPGHRRGFAALGQFFDHVDLAAMRVPERFFATERVIE